jgi:hypothetical protein
MELDLTPNFDPPQHHIFTCTTPTRTVAFSDVYSSVEWAKEISRNTGSRVLVRRSSIDSGEDLFQETIFKFKNGADETHVVDIETIV